MSSLGWLCVANLVAYACAVLAEQLPYRLRGRISVSLSWCFVPFILLCPLLIPAAYRMHDWFYRNVFQTLGGRRTPICSALLVFLVSGLLHELMFALATSRVSGYQFAFFTIQGPAALASGRLERLARRGGIVGKLIAHGSTILFMAVTSVLFFDGMNRIFPFVYVSQSPLP